MPPITAKGHHQWVGGNARAAPHEKGDNTVAASLEMELCAHSGVTAGMDLLSYYRHQAGYARRLVDTHRAQPQIKAALKQVAQEYDGIAEGLEKWCGRDPASRYAVTAHIDARQGRWLIATFDAAPIDQAIKITRHAGRAKVEPGRRTDIETRGRTSREVDDELTR